MRRLVLVFFVLTTACSAVLDAGRYQGGDAAAAPDTGPCGVQADWWSSCTSLLGCGRIMSFPTPERRQACR